MRGLLRYLREFWLPALLLPVLLLAAGPCRTMRSAEKAADRAGSLARATEEELRDIALLVKVSLGVGIVALASTWGKTGYRRWRRR